MGCVPCLLLFTVRLAFLCCWCRVWCVGGAKGWGMIIKPLLEKNQTFSSSILLKLRTLWCGQFLLKQINAFFVLSDGVFCAKKCVITATLQQRNLTSGRCGTLNTKTLPSEFRSIVFICTVWVLHSQIVKSSTQP